MFRFTVAVIALTVCGWSGVSSAATITAADLDYGISFAGSNAFNFDFSAEPIWTAGSQRSTNGFQNNARSGRVFVDFQLDAAIIAAANNPGAQILLTFNVDSIGQGLTGTPYTDGLDLRFLGVNAADRSANTLWNTAAVGSDQADLLPTTGPTGSKTVLITNANVLSQIQAASVGQFVALGFLNSLGTQGPVGTTTLQTYGFQMSLTPANYSLTIVPEPGTFAMLLFGGVFMWLMRKKN